MYSYLYIPIHTYTQEAGSQLCGAYTYLYIPVHAYTQEAGSQLSGAHRVSFEAMLASAPLDQCPPRVRQLLKEAFFILYTLYFILYTLYVLLACANS